MACTSAHLNGRPSRGGSALEPNKGAVVFAFRYEIDVGFYAARFASAKNRRRCKRPSTAVAGNVPSPKEHVPGTEGSARFARHNSPTLLLVKENLDFVRSASSYADEFYTVFGRATGQCNNPQLVR
jgi:hypothetical protein